MKVLLYLLFNVRLIMPIFSQDRKQAFEYRVGDSEISWIGSNLVNVKGTNKVSKILDDNVIEEVVYDHA